VSEGVYGIEETTSAGQRLGWLDRKCRDAVRGRLAAIEHGRIELVDGLRRETFGVEGEAPAATVHVLDPRFYSSIALRGAVGAAEAYMDGSFDADDLTAAIRVIALNRKALDHLDGGVTNLVKPLFRLAHRLRRNDLQGSRRNIAAHYDLGNDFFALFLDPTLTYSSAIFERPDMTLEEASKAKYERLCRKLALSPNDHLLEVGTGWGGMAIHAASRHGCRVTTTTISREQFELARERIDAAGLSDRVEVIFEDYRELRGRYDKLVSVEMIEAVGAEHWDDYFRVCSERLAEDGIMAIQAISVRDQDLSSSLKSVDFIKKYIFPGGQLVALSAIADSMKRMTDLRVSHYEDISEHYAETLRRWRRRFDENLDAIRALGLDDHFVAMWRFYLSYCEASFMERATHAFQMVFEKPFVRGPAPLGAL
jgi:cyclopropane-fatty-acyl-phospholipid synthase